MGIIANQIAVLILLAAMGYFAGRSGYLPMETGSYISKVVIRITAPALIITSMAAYDFTPDTVSDGLQIAVLAFVFIMLAFGGGTLFSGILGLKGPRSNVFRAHCIFGNVGYVALPLFKSIFGEKGVVYAVFFVIVHDTIVWTLGVYLLNRHSGRHWKENLRHLLNGNTVAFAFGLLFAFIDLQRFVRGYPALRVVYNLLYNTLNPLGNTTLYLMMLFIGLTLAQNGIGGISGLLRRFPSFAVALFKLIIVPAAAFMAFYLFKGAVNPFVRTIMVLELSMPCALIIPALAAQYGSDYNFAVDNAMVTTLFAIVTLPLTLFLLSITGGW